MENRIIYKNAQEFINKIQSMINLSNMSNGSEYKCHLNNFSDCEIEVIKGLRIKASRIKHMQNKINGTVKSYRTQLLDHKENTDKNAYCTIKNTKHRNNIYKRY